MSLIQVSLFVFLARLEFLGDLAVAVDRALASSWRLLVL